jgi:outer membrane receptor for ferrienterochelin and colicins
MRMLLVATSLLFMSCARAAETPVDELETSFGTSQAIALATGYTQPLFEAPSTATVLTREDFRTFDVRTLREALELVPGYLVSTSDGRDTVTTVRGITSRTLVLIDGVPVSGTLLQPFQSYDNVLLQNVQRLEIVRGPASSLYGADAVAGVINIITRTATHDQREAGIAGGSLDTYEAWYLQSFEVGRAKLGLYLGGRSTDATDAVIGADSQSFVDRIARTMASRAPGRLPSHRDQVDARVDAGIGNWTLRAHYSNVFNWQTALTTALTERSTLDARLYGATVLNRLTPSRNLQIDTVVDFSRADQPAEGDLFPPGAFGGAFPNGVLTEFSFGNTRVRAETTALFTGWEGNTIRVGAGGLRNEFRLNGEKRNFVVRNGRILPTGTFGPVPSQPQLPSVNQDNYYVYVQDQWSLARDISLTAGVRTDEYSDFGSTTNPRLALVWNTGANTTLKLLYGRAFRPPSINESYSEGVFTAAGKKSLNPTTLESTEASINIRSARTTTTLTGFVFRQDDLIQIIPDRTAPRGTAYTNRGTETGNGVELESTVALPLGIRFHAGYAYQERHGESVRDNVNLRFGATHAVNMDLTWPVGSDWKLGLRSTSLFDRDRAAADPRRDGSDYTILNAAVTRENIGGLFDLAVSVRNALDEDATDQSDSAENIPGDIPRPGRSVLISVSARW